MDGGGVCPRRAPLLPRTEEWRVEAWIFQTNPKIPLKCLDY